MANIHYFQRYNQKENWLTNSTLLLLTRIYQESISQFKTILGQITEDSLVGDLAVGVRFGQQEKKGNGVVDGSITQESFKLVIETKLGDNFTAAQLERHLASLPHHYSQRVLLCLSKRPVPQVV